MHWKTDYDPTQDVLYHTIRGEIELSHVAAAVLRAREREGGDANTRSVVDLLEAEIKLTPEQLRHLVSELKGDEQVRIRGKLALLTEKPSTTALALLFCRYAADYRDCQVFSTLQAANAWLGVDSTAPLKSGSGPPASVD